MIHFASAGRRSWAFLLSVLIDLLVLGLLSTYVAWDELGLPFVTWYLIHHVGFVVEGGTLGQRLAGLRVVRRDGARVGVVHAVIREVSFLFLSIPPFGLGLLWMLDEPEGRTWHDLLAGSVVVRELTASTQAAPAWADAPPWRTQAPASEQVPAGADDPAAS